MFVVGAQKGSYKPDQHENLPKIQMHLPSKLAIPLPGIYSTGIKKNGPRQRT